jgi:hypothetical protein
MADEVAGDAAEGDVVDKKVETGVQDAAGDAGSDTGGTDTAEGDKGAADANAGAEEGTKDGGDEGSTDKEESKADAIPENWRDLAADGDDDTLKLLKRYGSLKGVAKALKEKEALIRSGKLKQTAPDPKKDPDGYKEWLKGEGVPDDPTGYVLPETVTKRMTDDDKPLIASFTEFAHAKGARPDVVQIASEWYFDSLEKMEADQIAADNASAEEAEESLRESWGNAEYKGNKKLAERYVQSIPGLGIDLAEVRLPNGKLLGSVPEFLEWASDMGRREFGDVTFADSDSESRHNNRRAEIEKIRDTDFDRYERENLDKELRGLIEKDLKRGKR